MSITMTIERVEQKTTETWKAAVTPGIGVIGALEDDLGDMALNHRPDGEVAAACSSREDRASIAQAIDEIISAIMA